MTYAVKTVYANSRKPGADRIAFIADWREHGAAAMQADDYFGEVTRYVLADAYASSAAGAAGDRSYDGVGEIVFPSLPALEKANASKSRATVIGPHAHKIFGSPHPISLIVEEFPEWHSRFARAKLYTFVQRPGDISREDFAGTWAQACGAWTADAEIRATVQSYCRDIAVAPDAEFDGVEEVTFDTLRQAAAALADEQLLVRSLPLRGSISVLTNQVVMLDKPSFAEFDALTEAS